MSLGSPPALLVLHGPNLNLLGRREPHVYGEHTLDALDARLAAHAVSRGAQVECRQSNHEGTLIDWLQHAHERFVGVALNAGGYTHTSVALRDAVRACPVPVLEVHLSNTSAREPFRRRSLLGPVCAGRIEGLGHLGYVLALDALLALAQERA